MLECSTLVQLKQTMLILLRLTGYVSLLSWYRMFILTEQIYCTKKVLFNFVM